MDQGNELVQAVGTCQHEPCSEVMLLMHVAVTSEAATAQSHVCRFHEHASMGIKSQCTRARQTGVTRTWPVCVWLPKPLLLFGQQQICKPATCFAKQSAREQCVRGSDVTFQVWLLSGGDVKLMSMPGYGVDAYLNLQALQGDWRESNAEPSEPLLAVTDNVTQALHMSA